MISCMGRGLGNVCEIRPVSDLNILVPRAILFGHSLKIWLWVRRLKGEI